MQKQLTYIDLREVWNAPVSAFKDVKTNKPTATTLGAWLMACKQPNEQQKRFADTCQELRQTEDEMAQKALKLSLPAVTVGAELFTRDKNVSDTDKVKVVTGFTQVDIDPADNPHIKDAATLRDEVGRIAYVAFSGLSSRGRGVWALVKVAHPERMDAHFQQLVRDFAGRGIKLDTSKGRRFTDLRLYSYDPNAVINERFAIYDRLFTPKPQPRFTPTQWNKTPTTESIYKGAETFATRKAGAFTFTQGNRHHYIDSLCYYLNRKGVPQHDAETYINSHLMPISEIKSNCITHSYKSQSNLFGTWLDAEVGTSPQKRNLIVPPPTDKTDTEQGAVELAKVAPISQAIRSARPLIEPNNRRITAEIQRQAEPIAIDWNALNSPEKWELNPF